MMCSSCCCDSEVKCHDNYSVKCINMYFYFAENGKRESTNKNYTNVMFHNKGMDMINLSEDFKQ